MINKHDINNMKDVIERAKLFVRIHDGAFSFAVIMSIGVVIGLILGGR